MARTYDLLARGRYTPPFQDDSGAIGDDTAAVPATVLTLDQLGLGPGDYVGFRIKGGWMGGQGDAVHPDTGVVFQDANETALKPANFGQEQPFHFGGPNGGPPYAEVDTDFRVDANQPVYVRVPNNARRIAFSAVDWFVTDNCPPAVEHSWAHYDCPGLSYQVTVSEPNRPPGRSPGARGTDGAEEELVGRVATGMDPASFPEAEGFSAGPFSVNADPATDGQWRGNYPKGWNPSSSKFRGNRPASTSKRHWGWDIFAPFDTKLIAPVWPAQLHFMNTPAKSGYGPIAVLGFKYHGTPWLLMYAHLNAFEGADRRISSAEVIARAGCGGNANDAGCSAPLASGGRTNHVHVGLMRLQKNEAIVADDYACDPAMVLNWSIR